VYRGTVNQMNRNYDVRASVTYVFTKVKQNDGLGAVSLGEIEGTPALCLASEIEGATYNTWIYHHEGALWEIFAGADSPVALMDGQPVSEVAGFLMEQTEDGLFRFTSVDAEGREVSLSVSPRC
jgi:hypothetical protein